MEEHELSKLLSPLSKDEYNVLLESMRTFGFRKSNPITLYDGAILDGRHRYKAATELGIEPSYETFEGTIQDAAKLVAFNQMGRRNLNESQRALFASKIATMERGDNRFTTDRPANLQVYTLPTIPNVGYGSEALPKISVPQAAEMMNVSERLVRTINAIERQAPELIERIERGEMTANEASREIKKASVIEKTFKQAPEIPTGKFKVIYIDPPWQVGSMSMDKWESPIEDKYPTMSVDEIISLPISDLADDECALFIWTTHTFLPDTFRIIKEWGFKYFCTITWDKEGGWTQNGFHKRTEFLLYAYKGNMNINQYGKAIPTIIVEAKTKHSKKPDSIRDMIAEKTPEPRIEMFAREHFDGWTVWGNEV